MAKTGNYYPSKNITVYPASNGVDAGKLNTEENVRNVNINIVGSNYVVSSNPGGYDLTFSDNAISIAPGKAIVNGFEINTDTNITVDLPTAADIITEGYYKDHALLCLHTKFDSLDNLVGNVQEESVWYCGGIEAIYASYSDYTNKSNEYLLLGGVKPDGTIKPNKDKYTRFDAKYILIKLNGDVPPEQTTDLATFINNFLKGYWVSKAGDNEYGPLLFKSEPTGYNEEGFDHTTEDALSSNKFGVKITASGKTIVIKDENDSPLNNVLQMLPGMLGFYKGSFKGDDNYSFDATLSYDGGLILNNTYYDKTNLLELESNGGTIRLINNDGMIFSIDNNKATHNGVDAGKVIYANVSPKTIIPFNMETKYSNSINYLVDANSNIRTQDTQNDNNYVTLSAKDSAVTVSNNGDDTANIALKTGDQTCGIKSMKKDTTVQNGNNILNLVDNVKIGNSNTNGNLHTTGYIVAAKNETDLSTITVPDVANDKPNRALQQGDIYGSQIWSAVYNDFAEIFKIHKEDKDIIKPGMILAVDISNPDYYVLADGFNNTLVGVVSENPAFCAGGDDCEYGVPVALCGRVKVKMDMSDFKLGDWITNSDSIYGYGTVSLDKNSCVGKVVKIINDTTAEIIVSLR